MVYGSANEAGEIKNNNDVMEKAFMLGRDLAQRMNNVQPC
jgi:hypothetical protein